MKRMIFACALALAVAPAGAQLKTTPAPDKPLPVKVFGMLDTIQDPALSTDGKSLAAKIRISGAQYLAIMDLANPDAPPQVIAKDGEFDKRGDVRALDWQWADPNNLLVWIGSRQDMLGEKYDAIRVIGYNRTTKKVTPLGWEGAFMSAGNVLWVSREGRPRILLSRFAAGKGSERLFNPEVVEVDVETGRQRIVLQRHPVARSWFADGAGVVRMGTTFDGDSGKLRVLYRPDESKSFETIISEKVGKYSSPATPQIFLPGGQKALALSRHNGFSELYEIDLKTMKLGKKVFGVAGYDVTGVRSNPEGTALEGVTVIENRPVRYWFDPRMKEIQQVLDETFGAGEAAMISSDRARENLVIRVGGPDQAGAYYLYSTETGDLKRIGWANDTLKDMKLNPVRTIRYKASDGLEIPAVLTLPRLKPAKALPLIVLPHGGPWARDYERFDGWAQALAEMGYAVVQPNFRGSEGFGKAFVEASDGNWGTRMQDDLVDAISHLAGEGVVDNKRVCIFGWSYGGYAASRAAQRDGKIYRCAISGAGVHDLPDMVAYDKEYLGRYGAQFIGSAAGKLADISPTRHAGDFSIPILIVHGAKDDRVPVAQSRDLVKRLKAAGKVEGRDFVYIEQPRNTH
ncbi:MAG TPA: alpha/beta fold hydrolase, partial [Allosphingosinicella sp.]